MGTCFYSYRPRVKNAAHDRRATGENTPNDKEFSIIATCFVVEMPLSKARNFSFDDDSAKTSKFVIHPVRKSLLVK